MSPGSVPPLDAADGSLVSVRLGFVPDYDPVTYRAAELAGYEQVAADYDRWLAAATGRFADPLLDLLAPAPGDRVLDAACGPGVLSLRLLPRVRPGGSCLGIDFSPAMIRLARANGTGVPEVAFEVMDVERLDLPDASFDRVACGFGLMHFPDAAAALASLRRVLKPGGRLALSVWAPLDRVEFMALVLRTVKELAPDAGFPPGPPMFGFGTAAALAPLFAGAGLVGPEFREVAVDLVFPDFDAYWNALVLGAARLGGVVRVLPDAARADLVARLKAATASRTGPGGLRLGAAAFLAVGTAA